MNDQRRNFLWQIQEMYYPGSMWEYMYKKINLPFEQWTGETLYSTFFGSTNIENQQWKELFINTANDLISRNELSLYQEPYNAVLMESNSSLILEAAKIHWPNSVNISRLVAGTIPTGKLNAMAISTGKSGEGIVAFETGLSSFMYIISRIITQQIKLRFRQDFVSANRSGVRTVRENSEVTDDFNLCVVSFLWGDHPYTMPIKSSQDIEMIEFAHALSRSIDLFVLGHEYAHIYLGHLDRGAKHIAKIGGRNFDEILYNWDEEYDADLEGLQLAVIAANSINIKTEVVILGIDIFFSALRILEKILEFFGVTEGHGVNCSHPTAEARKRRLRKFVGKIYGHKLGYKRKIITDISDLSWSVLHVLWKDNREILREEIPKNPRFAQRWGM